MPAADEQSIGDNHFESSNWAHLGQAIRGEGMVAIQDDRQWANKLTSGGASLSFVQERPLWPGSLRGSVLSLCANSLQQVMSS